MQKARTYGKVLLFLLHLYSGYEIILFTWIYIKMLQQLQTLSQDFFSTLETITTSEELKNLESGYLGKKGKLKEILAGVKDLSIEDKKTVGVRANEMKDEFTSALEAKQIELQEAYFSQIEATEAIDTSLSFPSDMRGHMHPLSQTSELLEDIFISLGYKIEDGPHIEDETHNFDKLNIPADHPARDVWDTFWISDDINDGKSA